MLKRDKNFKLPKQIKTQLAFMRDPQARSDYKNAMIQAIIAGSAQVKSKKQKETTTDEA
jgi:hypothetical protein